MNEFQYSNLDENSYFRHLSITQMNSMTILGSVGWGFLSDGVIT